ncbi:NUDIX domain-containing protein [Streptomyces sp. NPDC101393]|uniref:NUDIX domain-containing protein n=1 Tax=Streptomyces sp. NPDC101393 TaxID=3366141 RepID=UPI00382E3C7C
MDQEGRLLLIRHRDGDREFPVLPGGRVERGETAAEAACREVREETGLRVTVGALLRVREYLPERHPAHPHHHTPVQQLQLYFRAPPVSDGTSPATAPDRTQISRHLASAAHAQRTAPGPARAGRTAHRARHRTDRERSGPPRRPALNLTLSPFAGMAPPFRRRPAPLRRDRPG